MAIFLTWKQQVLTTIPGYGLENFISSTSIAPSQSINDESRNPIPNPDFVAYRRQDQLLTLWLLSSINTYLLPQFV